MSIPEMQLQMVEQSISMFPPEDQVKIAYARKTFREAVALDPTIMAVAISVTALEISIEQMKKLGMVPPA